MVVCTQKTACHTQSMSGSTVGNFITADRHLPSAVIDSDDRTLRGRQRSAQDARDTVQLERLAWLQLVEQPAAVLDAYAEVVRSCVPPRVVVAAAARPTQEPDEEPPIWQ